MRQSGTHQELLHTIDDSVEKKVECAFSFEGTKELVQTDHFNLPAIKCHCRTLSKQINMCAKCAKYLHKISFLHFKHEKSNVSERRIAGELHYCISMIST